MLHISTRLCNLRLLLGSPVELTVTRSKVVKESIIILCSSKSSLRSYMPNPAFLDLPEKVVFLRRTGRIKFFSILL